MTAQVAGGIEVPITGDASGLSAAVREAAQKLQELQSKHKDLKGAVDQASAAMGAESAVVQALRQEAAQVEATFNKLTGTQTKVAKTAAESANAIKASADKHASLRDVADKLDSKLGKVQIAIGGIAQAAGASGGAISNAVGGFADLFMSIAGGVGPLAVAGAGFAALNKYIEDADAAAKKLDDTWTTVVGALVEKRNAIAEANKELQVQIEIQKALQKNPGADRGAIEAEIRGREKMVAVTGSLIEKERELATLKANAATAASARIGAQAEAKQLGGPEGKGTGFALSSLFERYSAEELAKVGDKIQLLETEIATLRSSTAATEAQTKLAKDLATETKKTTDAQTHYADTLKFVAKNLLEDPKAIDAAIDAFNSAMAGWSNLDLADAANAGTARIPFAAPLSEGMQLGGPSGQHSPVDKALRKSADDIDSFAGSLDDARGKVDAWKSASQQMTDGMLSVASAALSGSVGQTAGTAVGGVVGGIAGGAIAGAVSGGTAVAGGAAIGSALGSAIGGIMGSFLDDTIATLEILNPLFDGLSAIIASLQPLLLVLGLIFDAIGQTLTLLAPFLLQFFEALANYLMPLVQIIQLLFQWINLMIVPLILVGTLFDLLSFVMQPVIDVMRLAVGTIQSFVNQIIDSMNQFTLMMRKVFGDGFGVLLDPVAMNLSDVSDDFHNSSEDLKGAVEANTGEVEKNTAAATGQTLTNVPTGVKIASASFENARGINVGTIVINARSSAAQEIEDLKKKKLRGTAQSLGRNTIKDEKN